MSVWKWSKKGTGMFAAGLLLGTAGVKVLASKDAKKLYANCTAAVLRAKDCVMKTAVNIQENAEDIYAEAKQMNEVRRQEDCEYADESDAAQAPCECGNAEEAQNTDSDFTEEPL